MLQEHRGHFVVIDNLRHMSPPGFVKNKDSEV
jgi:hypothetical protein